jgi:D-alanine-D-alanine ligase-like ATP-grasp enzyme
MGVGAQCFHAIRHLIFHSLKAAQSIIINDKHCFELYGYDVLLDATLKPWLIEVNASPSLSATTPSDLAMKTQVINDVLNIL